MDQPRRVTTSRLPSRKSSFFWLLIVDQDTIGGSVEILELILEEEVAHVAAGSHWYRWYCELAGVEPRSTFRELLVKYAGPALRGPFNHQARLLAGFDAEEIAALEQLSSL